MGRILEGFWDCKYCGTKRIGGSLRQCPNCGKARGDDTTFYLDTAENRYVPEEKAAKINRNPDWICDYCNQLNSDDDDSCIFCGATRTKGNLNYFENKEKQKETAKPKVESYTPTTSSNARDYSTGTHSSNDYSSGFKSTFSGIPSCFSRTWKPMLIVLLITVSLFGIILLLQPKEYDITVNELSWERCINVERYQTVKENDWYLPSGGRLLYTREEYSHSEQVLDHYETKTRQVAKERISRYETYVSGHRDLGNGYFEEVTSQRPIYETYYEAETYQDPVYRSEPVYRTKYYYEIDKWLYERSVKTSGTNNSPYWGEPNLASDERTSTKSEKYMVKGIDIKTEETISFSLSLEDWSSLNVGQNLRVKITLGHGKILE